MNSFETNNNLFIWAYGLVEDFINSVSVCWDGVYLSDYVIYVFFQLF